MLANRHRRTLYEKLSPIVGDEEAEALLNQYPSSPGDEPVTVTVLDSRLATIDARISTLDAHLRAEMHSLVRQMVMCTVSSTIAGMGIAAGIGATFGGG